VSQQTENSQHLPLAACNMLFVIQVCVQLPTSADNMALFAVADKCHVSGRRVAGCQAAASVDHISCPQGTQQETCHMPLLQLIDGTDKQTDEWTDAQPLRKPCFAYYADNVHNSKDTPTNVHRTWFSLTARHS